MFGVCVKEERMLYNIHIDVAKPKEGELETNNNNNFFLRDYLYFSIDFL